MNKIIFSSSPHWNTPADTKRIMLDVILALLPALFVGVYIFGFRVLLVTVLAVLVCVLTEYVLQVYFRKEKNPIGDLSAIVTGILLAYNLPSSIPLWMVALGSFVAVAVAKVSYGGLGQNPFNPALVGRVFLLVSFPVALTSWPVPGAEGLDGVTGATTLSLLKEGLRNGTAIDELMRQLPTLKDLFFGYRGGCLGEVSIPALLLGAAYLMKRKVISWHIPLSYLVSAYLFSGVLWMMNPVRFILPSYHLVTGGIVLAAFYMATDMATSPMSKKGMILFGIGCGTLTILIRSFGSYPEGASFAILIMNALVPLINKTMKARRLGEVK